MGFVHPTDRSPAVVLSEACSRVESLVESIAPPRQLEVEEIISFEPDVLTPDQVRIIAFGSEEILLYGKPVNVKDIRPDKNGGYVITYTTSVSG